MNRRTFAVLLAAAALALPARAAETVLYQKASRYSTIIVTEDDAGLRTLRFEKGGARQSVMRKSDPGYPELPHTRVAFVGLALCQEPRRFLVVGLGGGTLPSFLRQHYPEATVDAVEIDPDVVSVAKQFFGFRENSRMRAHVADGRAFVENVHEPYDMIFLDAFGTDRAPPHLTTLEFLQAVRRALRPGGVAVGNLWGPSHNPLYEAMVRTYQEAFDELFVVDVRGAGNKILVALPRRNPISRSEIVQRAREVSQARQFRFDLGELVEYGYVHLREKAPGEMVLRDGVVADGRCPGAVRC